MPTYEYRCPEGHEFEKFQRMSDPAEASCPECGAEAVRIMSGGAGLLFKGEGFYITDYRSESYKKAAEKDKTGSGPKADPKTDSKSDSGSGSKGSKDAKGTSSKSESGKGGSE